MLVTPDLGECEILDKLLKDALSSDEAYLLKLYSNNYTPDQASVTASFTECNFTGYTAKTLSRSSWSAATTVSNKASSSYATQSWTAGSSQVVYGYYVQGATSTVVLWAEKFGSSRSLSDGDILNLVPNFTLNSET